MGMHGPYGRVRDIEVTIPVLVFIVARVLVYMIH